MQSESKDILIKKFKELFELSQEQRVEARKKLSSDYSRNAYLAGFYKGQAFAYLTAYENLSGEKYFKNGEDKYD